MKNVQPISISHRTSLAKIPVVTAGKVKSDWQITDSGRVKIAGIVSSEFNDADFDNCLIKTISAIEFPPPPVDGYYIEHTFTFQKEKNAK